MQNEEYIERMSEMQTGGRKNQSVIHNIIMVSDIISQNKKDKVPTYLFFQRCRKCFDKLWLKDCIVELENLGFPPIDLDDDVAA